MKEVTRGLTGAQIKWMAIFLMLIDHIGAVVLAPLLREPMLWSTLGYEKGRVLYYTYYVLRVLGRFSFPVFCFLLVEGFFHTRSRIRYFRNLLLFSLFSEIPFNLAIAGSAWSLQYQNVFFTLAFGLAAIWFCEYLREREAEKGGVSYMLRALQPLAAVGLAVLAEIANTDYGASGVLIIYILYAWHHKPVVSAAIAWIVLTAGNFMEFFSFPYILAVKLYNGERGKQRKYFFYIFYPAHLMLLYGISRMALAAIA